MWDQRDYFIKISLAHVKNLCSGRNIFTYNNYQVIFLWLSDGNFKTAGPILANGLAEFQVRGKFHGWAASTN